MCGVVHVAAVDGYSRKIVGFSIMPRKNPITIYNTIFRPLLLSEGIWDQLRLDHGTEFTLVSTIQQYLSAHRVHQDRLPVFLTTSRQKHRVERIWPEINSCIDYPIKAVLVLMEQEEVINMEDNIHKFAVSWVAIKLAWSPGATFIDAWNAHNIPGRSGGIPNMLAANTRQISALCLSHVPSTTQAIQLHETAGGQLSNEYTYGVDPIAGYPELQALRQRDFHARYPSMEEIFSDVLHNRGVMLREAILTFISISLGFADLVS